MFWAIFIVTGIYIVYVDKPQRSDVKKMVKYEKNAY